MRMILIFTLLILSGLFDCDRAFAQSFKQITLTEEGAEDALSNQEFSCAGINGKHCPEGIAKVIIVNRNNPQKSGLCSGFLVSPTRLVTNHHCISNQKHCDATKVVVYNGHGYENAHCKRVVKARVDHRDEERRTIDFSVIELDQDIRSANAFELQKGPLVIGDKLSVWVIDHFSEIKSRITELPCVLQNTNVGLELSNCASISGNSGSPVLNNNDEVVGVLWAGTTEDDIDENTPLSRRRSNDALSYITELKNFKPYIEQ
jgi:hypothetical protein